MTMETIQASLRKSMKTCGQTRYLISKQTGIPQSVLSRFAAGDDARGGTIDRLAGFLRLELRPAAARTRKAVKR